MVAARAAVVALPPTHQDGRWPEYAPTNRHTPRVAATPVMLRPHARASRAGVLGGAPPTAEEEERQGRDVMAMSEDLERKKRERDQRVSLRAWLTFRYPCEHLQQRPEQRVGAGRCSAHTDRLMAT